MKKGNLSQQKLAEQSGLTQGVISRAADLNYGDLTLSTIIKIAAGFDCAFVGKFVPFTELIRTMESSQESVIAAIPSFEEEYGHLAAELERDSKSIET
jgi:transcriptional regulator with XRE-family HTH domain